MAVAEARPGADESGFFDSQDSSEAVSCEGLAVFVGLKVHDNEIRADPCSEMILLFLLISVS